MMHRQENRKKFKNWIPHMKRKWYVTLDMYTVCYWWPVVMQLLKMKKKMLLICTLRPFHLIPGTLTRYFWEKMRLPGSFPVTFCTSSFASSFSWQCHMWVEILEASTIFSKVKSSFRISGISCIWEESSSERTAFVLMLKVQ